MYINLNTSELGKLQKVKKQASLVSISREGHCIVSLLVTFQMTTSPAAHEIRRVFEKLMNMLKETFQKAL